MVPFAGYMMPVQYGAGIIAEHMAVRNAAGLFDVSHMGEFFIDGEDALANLQILLTNDLSSMGAGQVKYSPMCNEAGGVVDDLTVYKIAETKYMAVVNAANRQKDWDWMTGHMFGDANYTDMSDDISLIALQGPRSDEILKKTLNTGGVSADLPYKNYTFTIRGKFSNAQTDKFLIISRTGYTGETGFEIYLHNMYAPDFWDALLACGHDDGLIPCGLGARDTLRLEAAMPLYGHELDDIRTPLEAGLSPFVKMDKDDFYGKQALVAAGEPKYRRAGLLFTERGIVRENTPVFAADGDIEIGVTTSGTHLPYVGQAGAMAYLQSEYAKPKTTVYAVVRGRKISGEVVKLPFYRRGAPGTAPPIAGFVKK